MVINPLSNNKLLDWFRLKTFSGDKVNAANERIFFFFRKGRKHVGIGRKCRLQVVYPFPEYFQKSCS